MSVPFAYRVLPDGKLFAVVCIHDETPDWWHVVARFADKDRAERYAEVESDITQDGSLEAEKGWDGDEKPAPVADLPATPPTKVKPENFRPPSPAEKARVGAALIGDAARETGAAVEVRAVETPATHAAGPSPSAQPANALRLIAPIRISEEKLTTNQMATWRAVAELLDAGIQPGTAEIGRKAKELGSSSEFIGACLVALYRLNLVQRNNDNTLTLMKRPPGPVPSVALRPEVEDRPAARNEPPGYQLSTETRETRPFWTSDRVGSFKRMWIDGATHKHIAAVFQITTDRVEQLRKQFGLKDRSVFTGVGA